MVKSGKLIAAIGSSRSGKSAYVQHELRREKNVLVWDVKEEYSGFFKARTKANLIAAVASKAGRIAFIPSVLSDFDYFCRVAQAWVKGNFLAGKNCAIVFEETADVTSPGKAPQSYGILLRRFLSYGVTIYAVTQRPAESDKTAVGNASIVRVCRLQLARDRKSIASDTGLPLGLVNSLRANQDAGQFDFVHVDTGRGDYRRGRLSFPSGKSTFKYVGKVQKITD